MTISMPWTLYEFVYRRASYQMWLRYRINKEELKMLGRLVAYLSHLGREVVDRADFLNNQTGNNFEKTKLYGIATGLIDKGFCGSYYYVRQPDSVCMGLSKKGARVLKDFDIVLEEFASRFAPDEPTRSAVILEGLDGGNLKRHISRAA